MTTESLFFRPTKRQVQKPGMEFCFCNTSNANNILVVRALDILSHPNKSLGKENLGASKQASFSHDRPKVRQDAKVEAPGLPNDILGIENGNICSNLFRIATLGAVCHGRGPAADGAAQRFLTSS